MSGAGDKNLFKWVVLAVLAVLVLYAATLSLAVGQAVFGSLILCAGGLFLYVYGSRRATSYRYLFPGLLGMALFVVLPLLFTVWIGFTNYSSRNLLTFERATAVLLDKTVPSSEDRLAFTVVSDPDTARGGAPGYRLLLIPETDGPPLPSIFADGAEQPPAGSAPAPTPAVTTRLVSERFTVVKSGALASPGDIRAAPPTADASGSGPALSMREVIAMRSALDQLRVTLPGGAVVVRTSLRTFAARAPLYQRQPDGRLRDRQTGGSLTPDFATGFYRDQDGEVATPGFRVTVGFKHFARIFTDSSFQTPFLRIFLWTVLFAGLTVVFTLVVGVLLGELLEWEELRFRGLYRILLFLPYAVPGFISILVFKGLFNENFGEINHLLSAWFGLQPRWFSDPTLAKVMLLVVNTWLGYPYIMLLWMGLRKSISRDLYEASALAGASPLQNFFYITWPLVKKPLTPLLISSFAYNFNNFVLIALLTGGRPDFLDSSVPAGTTDILVSYTYRIAFQDSGQNFGLAAAVSTIIFVMVAILSLINLRLTSAGPEETR